MMPTVDASQGRLQGILDQDDFGTPGAGLSSSAVRVLESRYLLRDAQGRIAETPRQLFMRVARAVAQVEAKWVKSGGTEARESAVEQSARQFFELMATLKFLPNSPTLMNAGRPKGQLSACFVLPIDDDLAGVFETLRDAAIIHKTGGGTGFSFGKLRPGGDRIGSSGGTASGPLGFLRIFDMATNTVKQGGTRRGANMAILPVDHPDIVEFIEAKASGGIANFNLSVGIKDSFMKEVRSGGWWELVNPRTRAATGRVRARSLWKTIAKAAWNSGDPGVVFLDRINAANPTPFIGAMESTNPCGEQPLLPYESCNLGSMNLACYVEGDDFDWVELERDIATAVRFLDDVIEANSYPLLAIEEITLMNRKIGVGIMGWADVLMEWGIPYDSEEAVKRAERVMERFNSVAVRASEELARSRGPFPGFSKSMWASRGDKPRRNATVTTIAPTGTISIIANTSSGIEPVYSLAYEREALEGQKMVFIHPALKGALRGHNIRSRRALMKIIGTGSVAHVDELPAGERRVLKTALEIKPIWHVRMQAAFQRFTENGVSKTINLPSSASVADVQKIYEAAFELGCKGITVFRDQSKESQVLRRGIRARKGDEEYMMDAVTWLLDDETDPLIVRKRASVGMATLSRAHLRRARQR